MIDSIFRVIVKVQMFFAVRAARKQARKDIAIEESYGDSGLFVKEEQPWEASYADDMREVIAFIDDRMAEKRELQKVDLGIFSGLRVELDTDLDDRSDYHFSSVGFFMKTNECMGVIRVNSSMARDENSRLYRAILWHETGHAMQEDFNISRYQTDPLYRLECEKKADLYACERGYGEELVSFLADKRSRKEMSSIGTIEADMRIVAMTSYLSRERETK